MIAGMYGHVTKIVRHREAAEIIEAAYNDHVNVLQHALLTQEVFDHHSTLCSRRRQVIAVSE